MRLRSRGVRKVKVAPTVTLIPPSPHISLGEALLSLIRTLAFAAILIVALIVVLLLVWNIRLPKEDGSKKNPKAVKAIENEAPLL